MEIKMATSEQDILKCWRAVKALRPNLPEHNFILTIKEMFSEGYMLAFIEEEGMAASIIGFRYLQYLFSGKHIYIDDLSTLPEHRLKGYGGKLIDFVCNYAKQKGFEIVTLDSGHHRTDAIGCT